MEKKAWARSATAKTMQAQFMCLAHNLIVLLEVYLRHEHGIVDTREIARSLKRIEQSLVETGRSRSALYHNPFKRTQLCLKFIRWLRHHLCYDEPLEQAIACLRMVYLKF